MFFKYIKKQDKNWSKNKDRSNRANSVRVDKKRKILFLREKKWKFEFTKTDIKNFFNKSAYRISLFIIFVTSVVIISFSSVSTASVAQFYASSCLGGWENPGNVEGAPQVFDGSEEVFSTSTSAILRNSMSEIFCGDFQAEISDNSTIRKAVLKLSWQVEREFKSTEGNPSPPDGGDGEKKTGTDTAVVSDDVLPDVEILPLGTSSTSSMSEVIDTTEEVEKKMEITEPAETLEEEPADAESSGVAKEKDDETTTIESDDFTSSLQDILDAPSDTTVEFTLTTEEEEITEGTQGKTPDGEISSISPLEEQTDGESETTTIESDDFTSSLQDILDAPSDAPVEFTLTSEEEIETESTPAEEPTVEPEIPVEPAEDDSDDVSFFKRIFKTVVAAETEEVTIIEPKPESEEEIIFSDDETTTIESDDFTSSLQDILDAPADTPVEFTLTSEEEPADAESSGVAKEKDDETTTIESDDFTSSLQDILDAPSDAPVEFTLTEENEVGIETEIVEQVETQEEEMDIIDEPDEGDAIQLPDTATNTIAVGTTSFEKIDTAGDLMIETKDIEIHSVGSNIAIQDATETVFDNTKPPSKAVARANDFLEIEYTFDSVNWQHLGFVGSDNWKDSEFELPIVEWDELEKLQVRIKNLSTIDEQPVVYLDSMWIEVSHSKGKILDPAKLKDLSRKKSFSFNDELKFEFEFEEKEAAGLDIVLDPIKGLFSDRKFNVDKVQLINARGKKEEIESFIEYRSKNTMSIIIKPKNRSMRPGKYTLETYVKTDDGDTVVKQQDFYLGVLAINVNKSIYLPEERAYLQMAALTDTGHTICNATLWMSITDPVGTEMDFSTEEGTIYLSGECNGNNVTNVPDYFAYYDVNDVGTYTMKLINLDTGHEIEDSFEVRNEVAFEVERVGPTRIYPPATYQVTIYVTAGQNFNGNIIEYVPDSFEITNTSLMINNGSTTVSLPENIIIGESEKEEKTTEIVWFADIKKGDICTLIYEFDAPDISPEFYLLGPLEFYE